MNEPTSTTKVTKKLPEKVLPPSAVKEIQDTVSVESAPPTLPEKIQRESNAQPKEKPSQAEPELQIEAHPDVHTEATEEKKVKEEQPAALGKIATKIQSMLRRRSASDRSDKRSMESRTDRKRKKYQDLDYMEDVHWSEM